MRSPVQIARGLCDEAGFDHQVVNDLQVEAAVRRSCGNSPAAGDHAQRLETDPAAREALLEELLVRESWFYRDQRPFEMLERMALGEWRQRSSPLRILSAPCAAGEEPYSIGMALMLGGIPPQGFRIEAVDLSVQGLAKARAARYTARALRAVPARAEGLCFHRTPEGECVMEEALRERVCFRRGNLLEPGMLSGGQRFDIVFCRNLFIYLHAGARQALLDALERILTPEGLLVVGHAEAALLRDRAFEPQGSAGCFAFRRIPARPESVCDTSHGAPAQRRESPKKPARSATQRDRPALPTAPARDTGTQLAQARALADHGHYAEARLLTQALLATDPTAVEAQHLMGLLNAAEGSLAEARRCLERALYLDPGHVPSLEHLALLTESAGDAPGAARLRERAARAGALP
jgi:chemotaxis protein methyltransferase WspC